MGKSFTEFSSGLRNVGGAFAATRDKVLLYTAALTGAAAGTALFVNNSLNRIDNLTDLAASLGVTVEELQGLKLAGNEAGIEANDFIKIIGGLSDTVDELNTKTTGANSAVEKLGTSFTRTEQNGVTIIRGIMATGEETKKATKEMEKLSPKALALQSFNRARSAYAGVIGEVRPMIIGTRLRNRGTRAFYRIRIPAQSRQAADDLCGRIRKVGGACIVLRT